MDQTNREQVQEKILLAGLEGEDFVAALVGKMDAIKERHRGKMDARPKNVNEQPMNLMLANGACLALNELKKEIKRLHGVALSERL